ncbi:MAG: CaiB/BaiF CoA transferase family protein [Candidatus Promineifilaceae bacterium]
MTTVLNGIRVLDMTRVLAGPWSTQILGDLGAEVIKIERPNGGDDTRSWGPPYLKDADGNELSDAAYFASANRNKQSVAIDFRSAEGLELLLGLVDSADILIENFKVGGLAKYGLDYAALTARNPRLIYCSITGFGQDGPYARRAGYDFMIQAMCGLMSVTGQADGMPGAEPMKIGVALTDILTGLYATIGVLSALRVRDETGKGQHIDISLMDVSVASMANQALNYLTTGVAPTRMGNSHPNLVPYQVFPTSDGHLVIAVGNNRQFGSLCDAIGHPDLAKDARFAEPAQRVKHRTALIAILSAATTTQTVAYWMETLTARHVPCGPINDLDAVFKNPQVIARELHVDLPHAGGGVSPTVASPLRFSETPVQYRSAPPQLGQHSAEILTTLLNLTQSNIAELEANGVIKTTP